MPSLISHLSPSQKKELFEALNYLHLDEIIDLCKARKIPYIIYVESQCGELVKTGEKDRKGIILDRMKLYLRTGKVSSPTVYPRSIISDEKKLINPQPHDRLFYNLYDKKNPTLMKVLKELTNGEFKDGAIARILLREFWSEGKAPTLKKFSSVWLKMNNEHKKPNPEWAYLTDRSKGADTSGWKNLRLQKSKLVKTLFPRSV